MADGPIRFPLVDMFLSKALGYDFARLPQDSLAIVESELRLERIGGYRFVHALWWVRLNDGRSVLSIPPGTASEIRRILETRARRRDFPNPRSINDIRGVLDPVMLSAGRGETDSIYHDIFFVCNASLLRCHRHGDCRRLKDSDIPPTDGIELPEALFPEGIVYGLIEDGKVVSVAYAHHTGIMEDLVANIGVVTAEEYRRKGYAQTVVSEVVYEIVSKGGEARYCADPQNAASIATARSCGFTKYGTSLIISALPVNLRLTEAIK
ncbi:MAG TPA: GNAT family N-acetyltransferase [Candidatus Brocadiia bacterium]|nr:GNAT family N-acetyltransferase [Candidatus Brocadiia bacterium]